MYAKHWLLYSSTHLLLLGKANAVALTVTLTTDAAGAATAGQGSMRAGRAANTFLDPACGGGDAGLGGAILCCNTLSRSFVTS